VSKTMDDRAMVFIGEPQDVDVYRADGWVSGSLLGWRHDDGGSCRLMVRLAVDSMDAVAWADLENVRLPKRRLVGASGPSGVGRHRAADSGVGPLV